MFGGAALTGNGVIPTDGSADVSQKSAVDYTALYGQQVKVVYNTKDKSVIYGVYANDSSVVVEGFIGDMTAASDDVAGEIKINDVIYKLDDTAATTEVYYTNGSTASNNATRSLADMANGTNDFGNTGNYYSYKMIDNDGDGKINCVMVTPFTFAKVTYVGSDSATFTLQHGNDTGVTGNVKLADIIAYEGMAKDDYVMAINSTAASKETDTYTKLDVVTGTVTGLRDTDGNGSYDEFKIDDNWYTANLPNVTLNSGDNVEYIALGNHIYYAKVLEGTIGADAVAVVYDIADKTVTGIGSNYIEAGLLLADGTKVIGEVVEVNSDEVDTGDTTATTFTGADAKGDSTTVAASALKGELVKYEVDGDKGIHVWTIPAGYDAAAASTQIMGFDGTLAAGASFNNSNDQVGGKELADDAVVFVWNSAKDDAKVYTGKEIKNTQYATFGGGTTYATGLYGKTNGFSYAQVVVLQAATWPTITTGSGYGYLVKDAYANKEDGVWYRYYSYWNGSEVVEAKEKDQSSVADFKAGSVITFDDNGDGTIKNVSLPLVRLGYVTGVNADGRVEISDETDNTKYNADTTIFYVDSGAVTPTGIAGGEITEGVDINNDGYKENNVMFITGGNNTFALIVVDVKHNIQKVNPVQQLAKLGAGTTETQLVDAIGKYNVAIDSANVPALTSALNLNSGYTLTVNGDMTNSGNQNIALSNGSKLVVTGELKGTGTLNVADGSSAEINKIGSTVGVVTVSSDSSLTVKDNCSLATGSNIGGTLTVATGKTLSAASGATITLNGTTVNGAVDLSTGTSATLSGDISLESGASLTFSGYTAAASTTLTVKSGATMTDTSGDPCNTNLTEVIEAGATVALASGNYIVPGNASTGVLALSKGNVTVTLNSVKIDGTAMLLDNVGITVTSDVFEVVAGSLDMNGKTVTASNTNNKVKFAEGVTITGYETSSQNFYTSDGTKITAAENLAGKTFAWKTTGLGSGSSEAGWQAE